jgi:hypothetical protein
MAKAKEAVVATLPPLVITPEKGLPVDGNFQAILGYLTSREKEVAKMKLSEDNLEQAKLVIKEAGAYQKAVEERVKTTIALLFDGPKDVLKSKAQELYSAISRLKSSAELVIDKVEEDRVADLNRAYGAYKESFQALYHLDERRLAVIELRKWYYNKTPPGNEKKAKDDLEQQFKDLKKEQDDHEADVKMVRLLCADEQRLNVQTWIDRLNSVSVSFIAEEIAEEKRRLAGLDKPAAEEREQGEDEGGSVDNAVTQNNWGATVGEVVGWPVDTISPLTQRTDVLSRVAAFETDFPGRTLKKRFELEYPCDMGDLMTELFKELRRSGVTARLIKEEVVF